jgi:acyl-CoA reductase-like NAD-dependent aldehyde dehydrogenase
MFGTPLATGSRDWVIDELTYVWRQAQDEARWAYEDWRRTPGRAAFAVYRALQDQADAAEDELAARSRSSRAAT